MKLIKHTSHMSKVVSWCSCISVWWGDPQLNGLPSRDRELAMDVPVLLECLTRKKVHNNSSTNVIVEYILRPIWVILHFTPLVLRHWVPLIHRFFNSRSFVLHTITQQNS